MIFEKSREFLQPLQFRTERKCSSGRGHNSVMAGLVPAIRLCRQSRLDVDARDKRGHDDSI